MQTLTASESVTVIQTETIVSCPSIFFVVKDDLGSTTLDDLFTWDGTSTLTTESSDLTKLLTPTYNLVIEAYYDGGT